MVRGEDAVGDAARGVYACARSQFGRRRQDAERVVGRRRQDAERVVGRRRQRAERVIVGVGLGRVRLEPLTRAVRSVA